MLIIILFSLTIISFYAHRLLLRKGRDELAIMTRYLTFFLLYGWGVAMIVWILFQSPVFAP
jgi:FtsH-binding integral membrane protein